MASNATLPSGCNTVAIEYSSVEDIIKLVKQKFPDCSIVEDVEQGGCSYTMKFNSSDSGKDDTEKDTTFVVQIRPARFALSLKVASKAREWYADLAPLTTKLFEFVDKKNGNFAVYRVSYVPGMRLDQLQSKSSALGTGMATKLHNVLDDLAVFHFGAWALGRRLEQSDQGLSCDGRVGLTLSWRLEKLAKELPSSLLRSKARKVHQQVESGMLKILPVVFTHGDLLPSNILVDEARWKINGLIDWAESEHLPFGISLYGIEYLLGHYSHGSLRPSFIFLDCAGRLRTYFWEKLVCSIPELRGQRYREAVLLARDVGILLWTGFAWDEGRIDRVIDGTRDPAELCHLEAFLNVRHRSCDASL